MPAKQNKGKRNRLRFSVRLHFALAVLGFLAALVGMCLAFAAGIRRAEKKALARLPELSEEARAACLAASATGGGESGQAGTTGLPQTPGLEEAEQEWDKDSGVV